MPWLRAPWLAICHKNANLRPEVMNSSLYSGRIATVGSVGCDQAWYSVVRLYDEHWRVG